MSKTKKNIPEDTEKFDPNKTPDFGNEEDSIDEEVIDSPTPNLPPEESDEEILSAPEVPPEIEIPPPNEESETDPDSFKKRGVAF
jgi:hypothetical protein